VCLRRKYFDDAFGSPGELQIEILLDFFRYAFDGSGADNFFGKLPTSVNESRQALAFLAFSSLRACTVALLHCNISHSFARSVLHPVPLVLNVVSRQPLMCTPSS
jgi:Protein of unknown function (DUF2009)